MTGTPPRPVFTHLLRMTDRRATFEHAVLAEPRREHGYCTDDMARVLVVTAREPQPTAVVNDLAAKALAFLHDAMSADGRCRNRMAADGRWTDHPDTGDPWGRMVWGLGTAAAHSHVTTTAQPAMILFGRAVRARSDHPRATAFAAIGAAEVLSVDPGHTGARGLLTDYAATVAGPVGDPEWRWPEPRLTYANAVLAEAMIAAGAGLADTDLRRRGLDLLEWLLGVETIDGRLSPTPVRGRGPQRHGPAFDQQPIEAATLGDACARAAAVDSHPAWSHGVETAAAWFLGHNDLGLPMWDPQTGGGFDGLHADRRNLNQGAESTLAVISTLQHAHRLSPASS